jgi:hypothetical protein
MLRSDGRSEASTFTFSLEDLASLTDTILSQLRLSCVHTFSLPKIHVNITMPSPSFRPVA